MLVEFGRAGSKVQDVMRLPTFILQVLGLPALTAFDNMVASIYIFNVVHLLGREKKGTPRLEEEPDHSTGRVTRFPSAP